MDWPSTRVPPGGIFQTATVKYDPATKKLLQGLMQESRLTMFQRNKQNYNLRNDDPIPTSSRISQPNTSTTEIIMKHGLSKRRNYRTIVESGAYNREKFIPKQRGIDREFAKKHLQDFMAFGKEVKNIEEPVENKTTTIQSNRFDQIKQEIQDRVDWLAEMEDLGEGHKYRSVIDQQIAARIREMKKLKPYDGGSSSQITL